MSRLKREQTVAAEGSRRAHVVRSAEAPDQTLYSRNWAFVDPALQARLARTTIFTAGTGLGSVIVALAARTGFRRFILADGDNVELSNLNRQAFTRKQIGQNKAVVTARVIRRILPSADIEVIPRFVTRADFAPVVDRADVVVNTIDLTSGAFLDLNRMARSRGKPVIFPMNLGWGGVAIVFTPDSLALDEFIGIPAAADDGHQALTTRLIQRVLERIPGGAPPYLREMLPGFLARDDRSWPYDPQLGIATHITAALSVRAASALVGGEPIRVAPDIAWCDARSTLTPTAMAGTVPLDQERRNEAC